MGAGRGRATAVRHFARHSAAFCSAALLVFLLVAGLQYAHGHGKFGCETGKQLTGGAAPLAGGVRLAAGPVQPTARGRTLVIYVYGPTDPDYEENFRFFLREAVRENDGCTYLIVMQGAEQAAPRFLPKLPPNARFVHHANECFDIGTVGWVLNTHLSEAQLQQYDYFIWLNPSVRGPFMPAYLRGSMHWTEPLLSKLRDDVKLVGPTISCEHATIGPAVNKAHVQTYVVATDREGMAVLRRSGTVFNCWGSLDEVIQHSEVGTSQVIFAAGWSIDSLMLRYQGVDWRDPVLQATCNGGKNPVWDRGNDGFAVDPLEAMWTKVKSPFRQAGWQATVAAVKYSEWARQSDAVMRRIAAGLPLNQDQLASLAQHPSSQPTAA